ncbi:MAG: ZIP family metal transporter [Solirubrobacterales bacterium]
MNDALLISFAAGFATLAGALAVLAAPEMSRKSFGFFLGLAAGVMTAVVLFDLFPSVLARLECGGFFIGFGAAWFGMILLQQALPASAGAADNYRRMGFLIMAGIALHDLPEGMAIALGQEVSEKIGLSIALGIGIHNIPEGMVVAAPMLLANRPRWLIALEVAAVALVTPLGTLLGEVLTRWFPGYFPVLTGVAAGVMVFLVLRQLWPEAVALRSRWRYLGLIAGILVIALATFM